MSRQRPFLPFLLFFLVITWEDARAQRRDSPKQHLAGLLTLYQHHILSDTAYLNAVDSITPLLLNEDSLEQRLSTYEKIAFADDRYGKYRVHYYRHLLSFSDNKNRYGSAIYYSEKNNEESVRMGYFEKDELPHSELFAIAVYNGNNDYARVFSKYDTLLPRLLAMPENISAGRKVASPDGASMAFAVLEVMAATASQTGDTARLNEAILLCEKMLDAVGKQAEKYREYMVYYYYIYHTICFYRENYLKNYSRARDLLELSLQEVRSDRFGKKNAPSDYIFHQYIDAFDFYFSQHQKDSARHYLDLVRDFPVDGEFANEKLSFLLKEGCRLQASEGRYEAAYRDLCRAYTIQDSALYAVNADKDNNLYVLAKAEDMENKWQRTEVKKRQLEQFNNLFFFIFMLLVIVSTAVFLI